MKRITSSCTGNGILGTSSMDTTADRTGAINSPAISIHFAIPWAIKAPWPSREPEVQFRAST
ncbi:MAG: hypothetical protein ACLP7O_02460 [Terracidiphilus sp.]